ncbi:hypothetical protein UT300012_22040 [Paraclostridium bifermentans]
MSHLLKYLDNDREIGKDMTLKQWLGDKFSTNEIDGLYKSCVLGGSSVHNIFIELIKDGYDINTIPVTSVVGMIRELHSSK